MTPFRSKSLQYDCPYCGKMCGITIYEFDGIRVEPCLNKGCAGKLAVIEWTLQPTVRVRKIEDEGNPPRRARIEDNPDILRTPIEDNPPQGEKED